MKRFFVKCLFQWHQLNERVLPWKKSDDPYKIWVSEIILQQTQISQGIPYYNRFITAFPTITHLAKADQDELMKIWEGLGYYTRARNMLECARTIVREMDGKLPKTYEALLRLKGIGPYSASAIASFAYGLPYAVVDGNVIRVLARFFGIDAPFNRTDGRSKFNELANELLDVNDPASYNQAIMNFGATVCTFRKPACATCPMRSKCRAYIEDKIDSLPVKPVKREKKQRFFNYLVIKNDDHVFLSKRMKNDIWKGLYEFPLIETAKEISTGAIVGFVKSSKIVNGTTFNMGSVAQKYKQTLSHQRISATFWEVDIDNGSMSMDYLPVKSADLDNFAFPRIIDCYLEKNWVYLNSN